MSKETEKKPEYSPSVDLLGGLVDQATLGELVKIEKSKSVEAAAEEVEEEKEEKGPPKTETPKKKEEPKKKEVKSEEQEEEAEEEEEEAEEEESEEEEEEVKIPENKFGIKAKKPEKKVSKLKIENFDQLPEIIKSRYGQEIKSAKDAPKFFESVDKWRTDSQNLEKTSKELDKIKKEKENAIAVFENLPPELLGAVQAHYRGEDYKSAFDKSTIDFSKEKHSTKDLVKHYFPGEFKDEDFDAEEESKELKIAKKSALDQYKNEKAVRDQRAKDQVAKAQNKTKAFQSSVKSTVDSLKKDFPEMSESDVESVNETLSSGSLMTTFYNPDGTLKQHAAKMLALALHGEEFIGQLIEAAQNQGESRANEDLVDRASKKPKKKNSKGTETVRKEVTEMVEQLLPDQIAGKRTF